MTCIWVTLCHCLIAIACCMLHLLVWLFLCALNPNFFLYFVFVSALACICVCCCLCVYLSQVRDRVTGWERVTQAPTFTSLCFSPLPYIFIHLQSCTFARQYLIIFEVGVLCMQFQKLRRRNASFEKRNLENIFICFDKYFKNTLRV